MTTIYALAVITAKRIRSQLDLTSALIVGLIASLSLVVCIPLYADAVFNRLLQEGIIQTTTTGEIMTRPTFGWLFNISGGVNGNQRWSNIEPLENYLSGVASSDVGLPFKSLISFVQTDPAAIYPADNPNNNNQGPLVWASLGFMTAFSDHITVVEGHAPSAALPEVGSPIEVLASKAMAVKIGLRIGESYQASIPKKDANGKTQNYSGLVIITGLWEPVNPQDEYWFLPPTVLENTLFISQTTFVQRISAYIPDEIYSGFWYLVLDGAQVRADHVPSLLNRISQMETIGRRLLKNVSIDWSPYNALVSFSQDSSRLTVLLYAFSIPIAGLILAFILLVSGLSVSRRRREIAIMRSRGVSAWAILIMMAVESLILGLVSLAISLPVGMLAANLIGQTRSFMTFFANSDMTVILSWTTVTTGLAVVSITVLANLAPGFSAVQKTIVSYRQERARQSKLAWWQKAGLDFLLLIPAGYSIYLLRQPGILASGDAFNNPLLFLAPALFILALTLLFLRLIPLVMTVIARLVSFTPWVGLTMAARHLSRNPGSFNTPLVILVLTLSLSAYTSSIAQTLDLHLYDQTYYQVGSDLHFVESGKRENVGTKISYYFTPVTDYLKVNGVQAATRVGVFPTGIEANVGGMISGRFMGVDSLDYSKVAFWRTDFSTSSLEDLMGNLAQHQDGVLASNNFLAEYGFHVGDTIQLVVSTLERSSRQDFIIVGAFDLFPTWYPNDGPLFVGNLNYLFDNIGETYPYQVWLKTEPNTERTIQKDLLSVNSTPGSLESAPLDMAKAQKRPERQGVLGLLFLGFAAAADLNCLRISTLCCVLFPTAVY